MRRCTKCDVKKRAKNFSAGRKTCIACLRKRKLYREASVETRKEYGRKYYAKNKKRIAAANAEWRDANRDKIRRQGREYYRRNKRRTQENNHRRKYGLTPEDFAALKREQSGRCKICRRKVELLPDHCHKTRAVRGLLCKRCNTGLGQFKDDPYLTERATKHLKGKLK